MTRLPRTQTEPAERRKARRGFLSAELIFTLPILVIVLFGLFEFSMLFFCRGELAEATRVGARKATLPGVSVEEVEDEVRRVVPQRLRDTLEVRVDPGLRSGDVVVVSVSVAMSSCSPDLLWPVGYSLHDRQLHHTTRMIRE